MVKGKDVYNISHQLSFLYLFIYLCIYLNFVIFYSFSLIQYVHFTSPHQSTAVMSWQIVIKSLPSEVDKPVVLSINDKVIYKSRNENYDVSDRFSAEMVGFGNFNTINIRYIHTHTHTHAHSHTITHLYMLVHIYKHACITHDYMQHDILPY